MQVSRRGLLGAGGALLLGSGAKAQPASGWPNRPIRLVVPFAPGGAGDSAARAISPRWGEKLGQIFVVENRTGAGGSVGGAAVAAAAPDGYTLMLDASSHLVNPALMRGLPFDYRTGFSPISQVMTFPGMLAVKTGFPARTVAEFVAAAKARPGEVSVGTQGNATAGHLGLLQLAKRAGIDVIHVPYRGGAEAARDLAAGTVDAVFTTTVSAGPIVDAGRAHALAVATLQRAPSRPDVPTLDESGFPGFDTNEWSGLFGPAGLPAEITQRLHATLVETLADPGVRARLDQIGALPVGSPPEDFARFVREGRTRMAALVREAGVTLD